MMNEPKETNLVAGMRSKEVQESPGDLSSGKSDNCVQYKKVKVTIIWKRKGAHVHVFKRRHG